ncbi:hypothetical protein C8Q80DRAFT_665131 [Daedaleopsis nitida]|nr:hypothetical protein C8Q80DRAFT_665131 [Daedaleopsis nitida]
MLAGGVKVRRGPEGRDVRESERHELEGEDAEDGAHRCIVMSQAVHQRPVTSQPPPRHSKNERDERDALESGVRSGIHPNRDMARHRSNDGRSGARDVDGAPTACAASPVPKSGRAAQAFTLGSPADPHVCGQDNSQLQASAVQYTMSGIFSPTQTPRSMECQETERPGIS